VPTPIPPIPTQGSITVQPYYVRQRQDWAVQQERQRHAQALYSVGEPAIFILMWHLVDFEAGLVTRCARCFNNGTAIQNRIAAVYDQPTQNKCPDCFGTTFEGGYRAVIVRPTIFSDTDQNERTDKRATVHPDDVTVESVWDFRIMAGDYVVRADNTRWQLKAPQRLQLRSGFIHPQQTVDSVTYAPVRASYEEPTTVAYLIPPTAAGIIRSALMATRHFPADYSELEDVRGPLIPANGFGD
jgi:hypothetical protein